MYVETHTVVNNVLILNDNAITIPALTFAHLTNKLFTFI
jgi:hypothetical protein